MVPPALRFDTEQRFTCQCCARCCQRGDVVVSHAEVEKYGAHEARRWFTEQAGGATSGAAWDPFEPLAGQAGFYRIRKRLDGACGFLSPANRCRIHEELGAAAKPLTCRVFPFRFHPEHPSTLVTTSFTCPTVLANQGTRLADQSRELLALRKQWFKRHPERPGGLELVKGRLLSADSLGTLRLVLRRLLDREGPSGRPDLRSNVARMAATLEDLSRRRVVRLPDGDFAEYLELTARYAASSNKPVAPRAPARLSRLFLRGLVFAAVAAQLQREAGRVSGLRLGLRGRLLGVLLHVHGMWLPAAGVDMARAHRVRFNLEEPGVGELVHHYLRSYIETLGGRGRPVLEELAVGFALLNAGAVLGALREGIRTDATLGASGLSEGILEAAELSLAAPAGPLGVLLGLFSAGVEPLYLFASGRLLSSR
jgi:lysine-N-methylase